MTENEAKAIKWMKNVRDDAVVTLDHIQKNEPNVSPMLYTGRKEKAETIIAVFEELEQYRAIGTVEEFKSLKEKAEPKKPLLRLCGNCQKDCDDCDRYEDRCPNCNGSLYVECGEPHKNCPHCGQALDRQ